MLELNNDSPILEWKDAKPKDEALARKISEKLQLEKLYFAYNLPLQIWISFNEDRKPQSGINVHESTILNYMPRKDSCEILHLDEVFNSDEEITAQDIKDFMKVSATILEHLAEQFKRLDPAKDPESYAYYPNA